MSRQTDVLIMEAKSAASSFESRNVEGSKARGMAAIASAISDMAEAYNRRTEVLAESLKKEDGVQL